MSKLTSAAETTHTWAEQRHLNVQFTEQTGSTNDDAKKNALGESDAFVLYVTGHQTAGRGRGTNAWLDTGNGEGLLSTWSYSVASPPQAITAPRIGYAVFSALNSVWPSLEWSIKAPNDIHLEGHKVGGLLVESVSGGNKHRLLVGFGFNVLNHPRRFQEAEHLGKALHGAPDDGEWFQFLDELSAEFKKAIPEVLMGTLTPAVCEGLTDALNANSARTFTVKEVSPQGDLIHGQGKVRWMDL